MIERGSSPKEMRLDPNASEWKAPEKETGEGVVVPKSAEMEADAGVRERSKFELEQVPESPAEKSIMEAGTDRIKGMEKKWGSFKEGLANRFGGLGKGIEKKLASAMNTKEATKEVKGYGKEKPDTGKQKIFDSAIGLWRKGMDLKDGAVREIRASILEFQSCMKAVRSTRENDTRHQEYLSLQAKLPELKDRIGKINAFAAEFGG
ncbi:MAG: hypothetical protein V1853_01760 [bacterium]